MMGGKKLAELMGLTQNIEPTRNERKVAEPRTAPGRMINAITGRDEALDRAERAESELEALKASHLISLDDLQEVEGRKRNLSEQEFEELKANIRKHGLITPITVRKNAEGHFEIVSGHNRVKAFKELAMEDSAAFGKIKAYLDDSHESKADELAFYANLLHPDLPDFEKFQGLLKVRNANPQLTTARALAEHVGMGEVQLGRLLKIGDLPDAALELLEKHPRAFGVTALNQFAQIAVKGRKDDVVKAMKAVIFDGLEQSKAVEMATGKRAPTKTAHAPDKPQVVTFRSGKLRYGSLRTANNVIRIELTDPAETAALQEILMQILEDRAKAQK
jgi:ParB family chromosome partitioning protein